VELETKMRLKQEIEQAFRQESYTTPRGAYVEQVVVEPLSLKEILMNILDVIPDTIVS